MKNRETRCYDNLREARYGKLARSLEALTLGVRLDLYNDVTAEQQVALHELVRALERARDVAGAVSLAFQRKAEGSVQ